VEDKDSIVEHHIPELLIKALREFNQLAEDWLVLNQPAEFRQDLLELYFLCNNFLRTSENFDSFYVSYFEREGHVDLKAKLFCIDPAPLLSAALERSISTIFFSATLLPIDYFKQLLTGDTNQPHQVFRSPFPEENVCMLVHKQISTKYVHRAESYTSIAKAIETICKAHIGNYMVYFPSYAFLGEVHELLKESLPETSLLVQGRAMLENERDEFLSKFSATNQETLVGLAVLGGIFGEGIDLVGDRLVGAVIIGVGIPQLGLELDLIKEYFDSEGWSGFAYAYQYPGFNRVLQATGRVIRTEVDRGVIVLIDERFTHTRYRQLFPSHWKAIEVVKDSHELEQKLMHFWSLP
jgi:DNA excision repair protein ERCC-2